MRNEIVVKGYILDNSYECIGEDVHNDVLLNDTTILSPFGLFGSVHGKLRSRSVRNYEDTKNRLGHQISIIDNCSIKIYYTNRACSVEEAENSLACMFDGKYYTDLDLLGCSEYTITGYKMNKCTIGGHNLIEEIKSHIGQYIIFQLSW